MLNEEHNLKTCASIMINLSIQTIANILAPVWALNDQMPLGLERYGHHPY